MSSSLPVDIANLSFDSWNCQVNTTGVVHEQWKSKQPRRFDEHSGQLLNEDCTFAVSPVLQGKECVIKLIRKNSPAKIGESLKKEKKQFRLSNFQWKVFTKKFSQ